ncbi:MAG TPA: M15 family metallopeptidase [Patescibacteria group bacterium]|nr:M15 family metallopeptidase [Patescibacteria group bacterium]
MTYRDPRMNGRTPYRSTYPQQRSQRPGSFLQKRMSRKEFLVTIGGLLITGVLAWLFGQHNINHSTQQKTNTPAASKSAQSTDAPTFNKSRYSQSDPASIWLVVNKQRQLNPATFVPSNLVVPNIPLRSNITSTEKYVRADMATALEAMATAANTEHIHLNLQSGYRSYQFQVDLYNSYVRQEGKAQADRESAHPGYSEHQTGMAADLGGDTNPACNVAQCFATTSEGTWLAANAYKYGFVIRYPADKESITGYEYEPWHVRYVGTDLATEMHNQGIETLEEFFGLGAAPSY